MDIHGGLRRYLVDHLDHLIDLWSDFWTELNTFHVNSMYIIPVSGAFVLVLEGLDGKLFIGQDGL